MAAQNRTLGKFHLTGLPPAPRGVPQIEVTFDIDANGILNVAAKDMATAKEQKITISGTGTLTKDDIDRMVKEAQAHSDEDKKRREEIEARNTADSRIYQIEKLLEESRDKISADDDRAIRAAIADLRKVLPDGGKEQIEEALKHLEKETHRVASVLYQNTGAAGGAGGTGPASGGAGEGDAGEGGRTSGSGAKEGQVIDAEYVDVDEPKR